MSGITAALNATVREAQALLAPLQVALQSEAGLRGFLRDFGWDLAPGTADMGAVRDAIGIGADLTGVATALRNIATTDSAPSPNDLDTVVTSLTGAIGRLRELQSKPAPTGLGALWSSFAAELPDGLVVGHLRRRHTGLFAILRFFGVIEEADVDPAGAASRIAYIRRTLHWDRLGVLITDPSALVRSRFQWTADGAPDATQLAAALVQITDLTILPVTRVPVRPAWRGEFFAAGNPQLTDAREVQVTLMRLDDDVGNEREVRLCLLPVPPSADLAAVTPRGVAVTLESRVAGIAPNSGWWPFGLELTGFDGADGPVLLLEPGNITARRVPRPDLADRVLIRFDPQEPALLLGSFESHRLQLATLAIGLGLEGPPAAPDASLHLHLEELEFVVAFGETDGFLDEVFGTEEQRFDLDVEIVWSSQRGLRLNAQAGLRAMIAIDRSFGPATLHTITVAAGISGSGVSLIVALSGSVTLGPVAASVEELGVAIDLAQVPDDRPAGVLGDLDIHAGFKPPSGIGLSVQAPAVSGGGYLFIDVERGEYTGELTLSFKAFAFTVVGLLNTQMPDGSPGFSLVLLVTAQFPAIQLGYGFTLNGAGGLLGINRTVDVEVLRRGVRSGVLDSVLFPAEPAKRAREIVSNLRRVFPPSRGQFTIGLMARLGWGPGQLLRIDLGLVVELPSPIRLIVLGRIAADLPDRDEAIAKLRLDVVGVLDLGRSELSVDATLHDSRLAVFALSGDMALRVAWGASPTFALSAGGFHPGFAAPPGFPPLDRLAISLSDSDNPRIRLETYLALTANTVQTGARLEVSASAETFLGEFSFLAYLGFDALLQLVPFAFIVDVFAGVDIMLNRRPILHAALKLTLSGPTPMHAIGYAEIEFFGRHRVQVEVTSGEPRLLSPPLIDLLQEVLLPALAQTQAWTALPPASAEGPVSVRDPAPGQGTAIHPLGGIAVRQAVLPLEKTITRYGDALPSADAAFVLTEARVGAVTVPAGNLRHVSDMFAPGQFDDLPGDQQLSRPSFESMRCGAEFAPASATRFPVAAGRVESAQLGSMWDDLTVTASMAPVAVGAPPVPAAALRPTDTPAAITAAWSRVGESERPLERLGSGRWAGPPQPVTVNEERYIVADARNLRAVEPKSTASSAAQAYDRLAVDGPSRVVAPVHEVRAP